MVAKHSMEWFDTRPFGKPSGYLLVRGGYCIWAWVKVSNSRKHWLISDPLDWVRLRAFKVPSAPGRCLLFCGFLFLEGLWTPPPNFSIPELRISRGNHPIPFCAWRGTTTSQDKGVAPSLGLMSMKSCRKLTKFGQTWLPHELSHFRLVLQTQTMDIDLGLPKRMHIFNLWQF